MRTVKEEERESEGRARARGERESGIREALARGGRRVREF